MARDKIHQKYFVDDKEVPGVTTVCGVLAKPALVPWAWGLGKQGIDYRKYTDDKADIGTLAHAMIMAEISGKKLDDAFAADFTANQIDQAENSLISTLEWLKGHKLADFRLEHQVVSRLGFGGTPDYYGKVDGVRTILDFKTGKDLYEDMWYQVAGYAVAILEEWLPVEQLMLVNVPRTEDENFTVQAVRSWGDQEEVFLSCLQIYQAKKRMKAAKDMIVYFNKINREEKQDGR